MIPLLFEYGTEDIDPGSINWALDVGESMWSELSSTDLKKLEPAELGVPQLVVSSSEIMV